MSSDRRQTASILTEDNLAMLDADVEAARNAWMLPGFEPIDVWLSEHQPMRLTIWQKAAKSGHAGAQWLVGLCFCDGIGVKQNDRKAVGWFRMAAEQGMRWRSAILA
ncbi:hypothetical protein CCP4SC76_240004 [Gammaproteobacteria bacterium]